jgi:hypothetical protein
MSEAAERFMIASRVIGRALDMMGTNRERAMYDLASLRARLIQSSADAEQELEELEEAAELAEYEDNGTLAAMDAADPPAMDAEELARVLGLENSDDVAIRLPEQM